MKSELEAAVLIVFLLIVTFALGFGFGGSGLAGASGNFRPPIGNGNRVSPISPSKLVIRADGVNPADLYESASYSNIPADMLVPLVRLGFTLVAQGRPFVASPYRSPSLTLITNSSGIATALFTPGNYSVVVEGSTFVSGTTLSLASNSTTSLNFTMRPSAEVVTSLRIVSPDTLSGVESDARVYALLASSSPPSQGFSELVGFESEEIFPVSGPVFYMNGTVFGPEIEMNATLLGSYKVATGYWATLAPSGTSQNYPSIGVILFQFKPSYVVSYTGG